VSIKLPLLLAPAILLIFLSPACNANSAADPIDASITSEQPSKVIPEFTAEYTVMHKSDPVGTAIRELSYQADGSIKYHYKTFVEWLIFSQTRSETSILTVANNQVTPIHYQYSREGTGKDKHYDWRYNAANNQAEDLIQNRTHTVNFANHLQDKLSYHLQHRLNLIADDKIKDYTYSVISTSGTTKDYVYQYDGEEELVLPYGLVKTIRFKREVKDKERITYAWFAPEFDYLLVKLYQTKAGNEQFEAQLSNYTVNSALEEPIANK
jgi:hypothetical protein